MSIDTYIQINKNKANSADLVIEDTFSKNYIISTCLFQFVNKCFVINQFNTNDNVSPVYFARIYY